MTNCTKLQAFLLALLVVFLPCHSFADPLSSFEKSLSNPAPKKTAPKTIVPKKTIPKKNEPAKKKDDPAKVITPSTIITINPNRKKAEDPTIITIPAPIHPPAPQPAKPKRDKYGNIIPSHGRLGYGEEWSKEDIDQFEFYMFYSD
jgi:hypothetical protein